MREAGRAWRTALTVVALAFAFTLTFARADAHAADATATTVSCDNEVLPGSGGYCTATVRRITGNQSADSITGGVTFTGGQLYDFGCQIAQGRDQGAEPARCSVRVIPRVRGTRQGSVRAQFNGGSVYYESGQGPFTDTLSPSVSDFTTYGIAARTVSTTTSCNTPVYGDELITCTVTAADTSPHDVPGDITFDKSPGGTMEVSAEGARGVTTDSFKETCTLSAPDTQWTSSCQVQFKPGASTSDMGFRADYKANDDIHGDASGTSFTVTPRKRPTTTAVSCNKTSVKLLEPVSCTITVTSTTGGGAPTGAVYTTSALSQSGYISAFDPAVGCYLVAASSTTSTCSTTYTPSGWAYNGRTDTVIGEYAPNPDGDRWSGSTGSVQVGVAKRPTAINASCTPSTIETGQTSQCTVSVTDSGGPVPGGGVNFYGAAGDVSFGWSYCELSNGQCTMAVTGRSTAAGTKDVTITVEYIPWEEIHTTSLNTTTLGVRSRTTSTSVSCDVTFARTPTTCRVSVKDTETTGTKGNPTGSVSLSTTVTDGSFNPTSCTLAAVSGSQDSSTCSVQWTPGAASANPVTATYAGAQAWASSTSGASMQTVYGRSNTFGVSCPSAPIGSDATCTFTVNDTGASPRVAPNGKVSFWSFSTGKLPDCVVTPVSSESSSCSVSFRQVEGIHNIQVEYNGGTLHLGRTFNSTVEFTKRSTTTALACPDGTIGVDTTCTVTVTDVSAGDKSPPGGTVGGSGDTFPAPNSCALVTVPGSTVSSQCQLPYRPGAAGANSVYASFWGNSVHSGSTAPSINVNGAKRASGTSIACPEAGVESPVTCTVTVADTGAGTKSVPTGTATLTGDANGTFSPTTCTLAAVGGSSDTATCTGVYTAHAGGTNKVSAGYGGDSRHIAGASALTDVGAVDRCVTGSAPATFTSTGAEQCFLAPAGIDKVRVIAIGAPGGGTQGGKGRRVTGTLDVPASRRLYVEVGGAPAGRAGGFNGGGDAPANGFRTNSGTGMGGGGASDVRTCARLVCALTASDTRLLVAGAGGGSSNPSGVWVDDGTFTLGPLQGSGGPAGQNGISGGNFGAGAGQAAGTTAGGGGGAPSSDYNQGASPGFGASGSRGTGGTAGAGVFNGEGGGGGAGLFGGGGGGGAAYYRGGGGGGGSSLVPNGGTSSADTTGSPSIVIAPVRIASSVALTMSPNTPVIADNGATEVTATARVRDALDNPVVGDDVAFSSDDPGQTVSAATDNGDGTYTATIKTSKTAGSPTITVTDRSVTPAKTATATLVQKAGPATSVALTLSEPSIVANGAATSVATAIVKDANGNLVKDGSVDFKTSADQTFSGYTNHGNGSYSVTITASTTAGLASITATSGSGSATAGLTQTPAGPATIDVAFSPDTVTANGTSTSTATMTVKDSGRNLVPGATVTISRAGGPAIAATQQSAGIYTAQVTATTTAGDVVYTASAGNATGTATLHQVPGAPASVGLTLANPELVADGVSTVKATAVVEDAHGNRIPPPTGLVAFKRGTTDLTGVVTYEGSGTYSTLVPATTTAGPTSVTATAGSKSATEPLTLVAGLPDKVELTLAPDSIVANGSDGTVATAVVTDKFGNRVNGASVSFTSAIPGQQPGAAAPAGNGMYRSAITSTTTTGSGNITASAGGRSATALLTQRAGAPVDLTLDVTPSEIVANGSSKSTATVRVEDANGNGVPGRTVTVDAGTEGPSVAAVTPSPTDGTYTAEITSSLVAGEYDIDAASGSLSDSKKLKQVPDAPSKVDVTLEPDTVIANGTSESTATVNVADANDNAIAGRTVTLTRPGGDPIVATDKGGGRYEATVKSTTTAGDVEWTAAAGGATGKATLHQTVGEPASVALSLAPGEIVADGVSKTKATAVVEDAHGNRVAGAAVGFKRGTTAITGTVEYIGAGRYTIDVPSTTTAGTTDVTATVGGHSDTKPLKLVAGAIDSVEVTLDPDTIVANGTDETTATAVVEDAYGNGVSGASVQFSSYFDGQTPGTAVDKGDGVYESVIKSTTDAGWSNIYAAAGGKSGSARLTQRPDAPTTLSLELTPGALVADGTSQSTAFVVIEDAHGNRVPDETVALTGDVPIGTVQRTSNNAYTATITSGTTAGDYDITATSGSLSATKTLVLRPGAPADVELTLDPPTLTANGTDTSKATIVVEDAHGNRVPSPAATIGTTGDATLGPVTRKADGVYEAVVTASTTAGTSTLTAAAGTASDEATLTEVPGPIDTVALALEPASIVADGSSSTVATATVQDAHGNGIEAATVDFDVDDGPALADSVSEEGDGVYTTTITSSTTAGRYDVGAAAGGVRSSSVELLQTAGAPASLDLDLDPDSIVADGSSTTKATATLADAHGNGIAGEDVKITSGIDQPVTAVKDNDDGTYEVEITSTKVAGSVSISAELGDDLSDAVVLTQTPGDPHSIALVLEPATITANGTAQSTATATVEDVNGNGVPGASALTIVSEGDQEMSDVTDNDDGTYSAAITASTTAGDYDVTAELGALSDVATLVQEPGAPDAVKVTLDPASLVADGSSKTVATATVEDAWGNPIHGQDVSFDSNDDNNDVADTVANTDGTYEATITASTTAHTVKVTATAGTLSGSADLTQTPGAPDSLSLALEPDTIVADGSSKSTATATVEDANGNAVPGEDVDFASEGDQDVADGVDNGDGTYSAEITSTVKAGSADITAKLGSLADTAELVQTEGAPDDVTLKLAPSTVVADGASETEATVTVHDAHDNPVRGAGLEWSSTDPGQAFGAVTDNADGTYTVPVKASKKVGRPTLTVTAGDVSDSAELTQTPGPVARVELRVDRDSVPADGAQQVSVLASLFDANDNPVSGQNVDFAADDPDGKIGAAKDNGDGTYSARYTAGRRVGTVKLSATHGKMTGWSELEQSALPVEPVAPVEPVTPVEPVRPTTPSDSGGSGDGKQRRLPRFRSTKKASTRADKKGYVIVPATWLDCPDGVVSCLLNARLDRKDATAGTSTGRRKKSVYASKVSTVLAPGSSRVKLRLSAGARRLLRSRGVLEMTVKAVAIARDGGRAELTKTFVVRLPKAR